MGRYTEDSIVAEAEEMIGTGEQVLAAGYFGLPELLGAQIAGGTAGAVAGSMVESDAGGAIGAGLGGAAAKKGFAESQGVTVRMILAVTADHIYVLNRDTGDRLRTHVATFDRQTCHVEIKKSGFQRIVTLTDPASDESFRVHGGTSPISVLSKGDKAVFALLLD